VEKLVHWCVSLPRDKLETELTGSLAFAGKNSEVLLESVLSLMSSHSIVLTNLRFRL
jgi:hypothetical protein